MIRLLSSAPSSSDSEREEGQAPSSPPPPRPPRVPWFEVQHRFQDLVNRTPWNGCGFSRDGEYIIGGASFSPRFSVETRLTWSWDLGAGHKASHNIYIWDRESGGLIKILEGPKDPLEDLDVPTFSFPSLSGQL